MPNQHSPQERPEVWMQCPGCWSADLYSAPTPESYVECGCGEKLTVIDLRDGGEITTDRGSPTSELAVLQDREAELEKHPTLAMVRAGHRVRGGFPNWLKGAPSHVLAELLAELAEDGWELTRCVPEARRCGTGPCVEGGNEQ